MNHCFGCWNNKQLKNTEMTPDFSGHFKLIARLPEGAMQLHPYFQHYFGDIRLSTTRDGGHLLELSPTIPFMYKSISFKLDEEFEEVIQEKAYKTKFSVNTDGHLIQTSADQESTYTIIRMFNMHTVKFYPQDQIEVRMKENNHEVPWYLVLARVVR